MSDLWFEWYIYTIIKEKKSIDDELLRIIFVIDEEFIILPLSTSSAFHFEQHNKELIFKDFEF